MPRIDLHTHTKWSDGKLEPGELMALAAKKDVRVVAITDHDSVAGLKEGKRAAEENGVELVPGIEISALFDGKEVHILGLLIDPADPGLNAAAEQWLESRRERNRRMLASLAGAGVYIDEERLFGFRSEIAVTRSHFASGIIEAGYCDNKAQAFKKYLSPGTRTFVKRRVITAREAIGVILGAGGVPALAHPLRYRLEPSQVEGLVKGLTGEGICGLECYYSGHSLHEQEQLKKMAEKYRLCVTGGSDFHGDTHDEAELGTGYGRLYVPYSVYDSLKSRKHALALVNGKG